ncbi:hypothetical protein EVAR_48359_1 [Eumeta japonica]|uniref:Uncharacterized protein n=1 Tax=Eumeta variegata TaxID=151549 RepID=A0A4C1WII3_EUMVA|nr:hypothetical protein EVAR_48359_1 [Eumeta japonica]
MTEVETDHPLLLTGALSRLDMLTDPTSVGVSMTPYAESHTRFGPWSRSRFRFLPVSNLDSALRLAYDLDSAIGHGSDLNEAVANPTTKIKFMNVDAQLPKGVTSRSYKPIAAPNASKTRAPHDNIGKAIDEFPFLTRRQKHVNGMHRPVDFGTCLVARSREYGERKETTWSRGPCSRGRSGMRVPPTALPTTIKRAGCEDTAHGAFNSEWCPSQVGQDSSVQGGLLLATDALESHHRTQMAGGSSKEECTDHFFLRFIQSNLQRSKLATSELLQRYPGFRVVQKAVPRRPIKAAITIVDNGVHNEEDQILINENVTATVINARNTETAGLALSVYFEEDKPIGP